jgi:hypothetical protein
LLQRIVGLGGILISKGTIGSVTIKFLSWALSNAVCRSLNPGMAKTSSTF